MKTKIYLRIAKAERGFKVSAHTKPNQRPLSIPATFNKAEEFLPTISFAVDFNIPEKLFEQATQTVAEINLALKDAKINAEIDTPKSN